MDYLAEKTKEKATFSLAGLKRQFPKDKEQIKNLKFYGLIEPVNIEYPDTVRANIYNN